MKILFVNTSDTKGGAARAAMRIMQAVEAEGSKVQMLVKHKTSSLANVLPLDAFLPHNSLYKAADWLATKLKNKLQHARWRPYRHSQDGNYKSDLRGTYLGGAMRSIDYDVLHLHWINLRFVRLEDLPTDKPIVWTLHDSWPFCGVCHTSRVLPGAEELDGAVSSLIRLQTFKYFCAVVESSACRVQRKICERNYPRVYPAGLI